MHSATVEVQATMPQRYEGEMHGSNDKFFMTPSDADDAVAVRMVVKTGHIRKPAASPVAARGAYPTRNTAPSNPEPSEKAPESVASPITASPAASDAPAAQPQKPYPHRAMTARR